MEQTCASMAHEPQHLSYDFHYIPLDKSADAPPITAENDYDMKFDTIDLDPYRKQSHLSTINDDLRSLKQINEFLTIKTKIKQCHDFQ